MGGGDGRRTTHIQKDSDSSVVKVAQMLKHTTAVQRARKQIGNDIETNAAARSMPTSREPIVQQVSFDTPRGLHGSIITSQFLSTHLRSRGLTKLMCPTNGQEGCLARGAAMGPGAKQMIARGEFWIYITGIINQQERTREDVQV